MRVTITVNTENIRDEVHEPKTTIDKSPRKPDVSRAFGAGDRT